MSASYPSVSVSLVVALFVSLCFFPIARAASPAVTVFNPLENQLPTVARVNKYWSWAPSLDTFHSTDGDPKYTTSPLPHWMVFDSMRFTFAGIPSEGDEGVPEVIVTAQGSSSSASSHVTFCVSKDPSPIPRLPIATQFRAGNPSLSSVLLLSPGSSLATGSPILRIPSGWSFSIGFEPKTYAAVAGGGDIYYGIKQANGSRLPEWMIFNRQMLTLNGVVPSVKKLRTPTTFHLEFHGSDQEACSAASMPFDIVVASHEVSVTASMPTINVTTARSFNVTLNSPADFAGVLVDSEPIQVQSISNLTVDLSGYGDWLQFNSTSRSLYGSPKPEMAGQKPTLPVKIETVFNQSIDTNISVVLVPSYFTQEVLPTIYAAPGDKISFDLARYFSNSSFETHDDAALSVTYEPPSIGSWFESSGGLRLKGMVPVGYSTANISIMFTAYSHITHSTSHASLPIYVITPEAEDGGRGGSLSRSRHAQLALALAITLAIIGGLCSVCGILTILRRARKVDGTVCDGEKNICSGENGPRCWPGGGKFLGWRKCLGKFGRLGSRTLASAPGQLGGKLEDLGLRRVQERSGNLNQSLKYGTSSNAQRLATVNKREFFASLRQTLRHASEKYPLKQRGITGFSDSQERPIVVQMKPGAAEEGVLPSKPLASEYPADHFHELVNSGRGDKSHPSAWAESTTGYSALSRLGVLRPNSKAQIHSGQEKQDSRLVSRARSQSKKSLQDLMSIGAVVPTPVRPRPYPLTRFKPLTDRIPMGGQVSSQEASTVKTSGSTEGTDETKGNNSEDELRMGFRYLQALGADSEREAATSPTISSTTRFSPSSSGFHSSSERGKEPGYLNTKKVIVIPGQEFRFLVRIPPVSIAARAEGMGAPAVAPLRHEYGVRIISGRTLSRLHVDLNGADTRGVAEITGESTREDIGVVAFGIYAGWNDEICLAMVIIEVAEAR